MEADGQWLRPLSRLYKFLPSSNSINRASSRSQPPHAALCPWPLAHPPWATVGAGRLVPQARTLAWLTAQRWSFRQSWTTGLLSGVEEGRRGAFFRVCLGRAEGAVGRMFSLWSRRGGVLEEQGRVTWTRTGAGRQGGDSAGPGLSGPASGRSEAPLATGRGPRGLAVGVHRRGLSCVWLPPLPLLELWGDSSPLWLLFSVSKLA